jgi:hypothetical protein
MKLTDFKCKEVYIVAGDEDQDSSPIFLTTIFEDLMTFLKSLTPTINSTSRVFHGVITPAQFLPTSLYGKSAFMVCQDPSNIGNGCVVEIGSDCVEDIAQNITNILSCSGETLFSQEIGIDDIFILYGYELQTCISIDEDDVDEEVMELCKIIGNEVETTAYTVSKQKNIGDQIDERK